MKQTLILIIAVTLGIGCKNQKEYERGYDDGALSTSSYNYRKGNYPSYGFRAYLRERRIKLPHDEAGIDSIYKAYISRWEDREKVSVYSDDKTKFDSWVGEGYSEDTISSTDGVKMYFEGDAIGGGKRIITDKYGKPINMGAYFLAVDSLGNIIEDTLRTPGNYILALDSLWIPKRGKKDTSQKVKLGGTLLELPGGNTIIEDTITEWEKIRGTGKIERINVDSIVIETLRNSARKKDSLP